MLSVPGSARSDRSQAGVAAIRICLLAFAFLFSTPLLDGQAAKPPPDEVVFVNGERLTGTLEKADGKNITFKSSMAGEITVSWTKIKELHSSQTFALLKPNQKLTRREALADVPEGAVSAEADSLKETDLTVRSPTTSTTVPLAQVEQLIPTAQFAKALAPVSWLGGWAGTAGGGIALVRATTNTTTYNTTIALTRALPQADWLPARSKTLIDFSQAYGTTTEAGEPTIETNILHGGAEQDYYFSAKAFALGDLAFDHDFSQNLALQQTYGVGVGANIVKNAKQQLDFRGQVNYEKQTFSGPSTTDNIIGSTFGETYLRNLPHKVVLNEAASASPAWNVLADYSAHVNLSLGFPIFKGFAFTVSGIDDYLNNAPAGSKSNSFQFTTNVTYTIKPK